MVKNFARPLVVVRSQVVINTHYPVEIVTGSLQQFVSKRLFVDRNDPDVGAREHLALQYPNCIIGRRLADVIISRRLHAQEAHPPVFVQLSAQTSPEINRVLYIQVGSGILGNSDSAREKRS